MNFVKSKHFRILFGYNAPRDIPISPARYFNQRLLNFVSSLYHMLIIFSLPGLCMSSSIVKNNFKGTTGSDNTSDNAFSFMSSFKGIPACWKQFLFDLLAMVKQLGIPTYFLTFSFVDLRWEELPYIINKLNNLGLSDEKLRNLSYQEQCNLLNK